MTTPPNQPGDTEQDKAKASIQKQLDRLLVEIEEVEPGTIEPGALPKSYQAKPTGDKPEEPGHAAAAETTEPEIDALLNSPPAEAGPADEKTPEQTEMLAALNTALAGLGDGPAEDEPVATTGPEPAAQVADEALSMEDRLQQEINALINAEPQPAPSTEQAVSVAEADSATAVETEAAGTSTQDQIAIEIEGLLNAEHDTATQTADAPAEAAIDELDKMLAQEIDEDDELAGDFRSVEDVTAGIQVGPDEQLALDDEHAATARDVADELDSQPEDLPAMSAAPSDSAEDPFAVLAELAETNEEKEKEHQARIRMQTPNWSRWVETGREKLLNACFVINWPARRFLNTEWRANLGYIALLNLFFGVGFWIVMILF
ncbi:MAG: hypothetical protein AAGI37_04535 [Planctomycetota bacterium]